MASTLYFISRRTLSRVEAFRVNGVSPVALWTKMPIDESIVAEGNSAAGYRAKKFISSSNRHPIIIQRNAHIDGLQSVGYSVA